MVWQLVSVLPNIDMQFAAEARHCAIVPAEDERVLTLRADHPNFHEFLDRFHTAHGRPVAPAVLLIDADAPESRRSSEAFVGLRNCLSVATVLRQSALELAHPWGHRILFSDPFEFYPWTLQGDYKRMASITPASIAVHRVDEFGGQPLAGSPVHTFRLVDVDRPLFSELASHWDRAFERRRIPPFDRALFRSLNMANAALAMPAIQSPTYHDYGRQCALWISAFEILAHHDAGRNRGDLPAVVDLLTKKRLWNRALNARRYSIRFQGKLHRVALPAKLYEKLYRVRNDFLHGNAVSVNTLLLKESGRFIGHFAPLLYRIALRNFLDLRFEPAGRPLRGRAKIEAGFAEHRYEQPQHETEDALALARVPPADDD